MQHLNVEINVEKNVFLTILIAKGFPKTSDTFKNHFHFNDSFKEITVFHNAIPSLPFFYDPTSFANKKIHIIADESNFDGDQFKLLPYSDIRIIFAHGSTKERAIENTEQRHLEHKIEFFKYAYTIYSERMLCSIRDKQKLLFILSCYAGTIHHLFEKNNNKPLFEESILVTCIDNHFVSLTCIDEEIALYVSKLVALNVLPTIIILCVIARFPVTIKVKMPGEKSAQFGSTLTADSKELTEVVLAQAREYLKIEEGQLSYFELNLTDNFKRRQALYFFTLLLNWQYLDIESKNRVIDKLKLHSAENLNNMVLWNKISLLQFILLLSSHIAIEDKLLLTTIWVEARATVNTIHIGELYHLLATQNQMNVKSVAIINALIKAGANLHVRMHDGNTLLHLAILSQKSDIIHYLIDHDVDLETQNNLGATPLHLAAALNSLAVLSELMGKKVNMNVKDIDSNTPLHRAIIANAVSAVSLLIQHGVDINIKNVAGNDAFSCANPTRYSELKKVFDEGIQARENKKKMNNLISFFNKNNKHTKIAESVTANEKTNRL